MKVRDANTHAQLSTIRALIQEVIREVLLERYYHDEKGRLTGCRKGAVFSMSKAGINKLGIDDKYLGRGIVTSCPDKEGELPKLKTPFGMNTSKKKAAGRMKMPSGDAISPKYRVKDYPAQYEALNHDVRFGMEEVTQALLHLEEAEQAGLEDFCSKAKSKCGSEWARAFMMNLNKAVLASKGELNKTK
jgi:hypothetical protein